jgi:hypothetical protein
LISAVFLVGYTVQGGVGLAGGAIASTGGLTTAIIWVAVIMSVFSLTAMILALTARSTVATGSARASSFPVPKD